MGHSARRLVLLGVATIGLLALTRGRAKLHHTTADAPHTAGRVLHGARWYDLVTRVISFGRDKAIRETLIALAAPAPGETVLDVGCGTGTLALALKSRGGTGAVHGIDASPEMIDVAKEKAAQAGAAIAFQVALIEALPFAAATFGLVTSSLMLHHLVGRRSTGRGSAGMWVRRADHAGHRSGYRRFHRPAHRPSRAGEEERGHGPRGR